MWEHVLRIWRNKELRNSVLFVLAMLVVFRVAAHIPVPGVNIENLRAFFASNQILGLVNVFSGGAMDNFSVVALGVGPYITASIIFQLLGMIVPRLEELQKEGSAGQERINQYTRIATVPLAILQSYGLITLLSKQTQNPIISGLTPLMYVAVIAALSTGTVFLMWLGELISERKIGNGVSIIIFSGIIARLPQSLQQVIVGYDSSQLVTWAGFAVIAALTIAGVVLISEGQRNVPVVYAKQMRGNRMVGGAETHLPLRVNMAGVIPIIFAISIILFPTMVAQFFVHAKTAWIALAAQKVAGFTQDRLVYGISYFVLVFLFTYFYTAVVFHPDQVAENLQKQGGFISGVRPGRPTAEYLMRTLNRITPAGAFFLAMIAVLPLLLQQWTGSQSLVIGGTGLLIVVSVIIEIVNQMQSQLTMNEYETI